jgi:hypothetical protein
MGLVLLEQNGFVLRNTNAHLLFLSPADAGKKKNHKRSENIPGTPHLPGNLGFWPETAEDAGSCKLKHS